MIKLKLFINNEWVDSSDGNSFESKDPSKNEVIATISSATKDDVDKAVKAARDALPSWSGLDCNERADLMIKAANIIRRRKKELAKWEAMDVGKPILEAEDGDMYMAIKAMEHFANLSRCLKGSVIPLPGNKEFDYETYEPYGVVGAIVPWNFPIHIGTRAICPALAAGNTVVLKPSTLAPITCTILGEIFIEAGFPKGVLNIINGSGSVAGKAIIYNSDIDMISFTGSTKIGREVLKASSETNLKKVILELGGKGPFIAEVDCNVDQAVNSVIIGFCYMQGEVCCASTRLYIHQNIYNGFIEKLVSRCNDIKIGPTLDPETQMGSLINEEQLVIVDNFVKEAIKDGARLLCGGERYDIPPCDKGNFYKPTVLEVKDNDLKCVQEEIFGPVLVVRKYKNLDEAIKLANDSKYALGASIWSEDTKKLYWSAKKLNAGIVWMNTNLESKIEASYGGNKLSGVGREGGLVGLMEYLKVKNNVLYIGPERNYYNFKK